MACMFYFARCMNIIFNSLLVQLVKYDVHTTHKIKSIHSIFITYYYYSYFIIQCLTSNIISMTFFVSYCFRDEAEWMLYVPQLWVAHLDGWTAH